MKFDEKILLIELYDIYYALFTKRQQEIFELYIDDDYTMSEIAKEIDITIAGVSKTIKQVQIKLHYYEKNLKIIRNYKENYELLKNNDVDEIILKKIKK